MKKIILMLTQNVCTHGQSKTQPDTVYCHGSSFTPTHNLQVHSEQFLTGRPTGG